MINYIKKYPRDLVNVIMNYIDIDLENIKKEVKKFSISSSNLFDDFYDNVFMDVNENEFLSFYYILKNRYNKLFIIDIECIDLWQDQDFNFTFSLSKYNNNKINEIVNFIEKRSEIDDYDYREIDFEYEKDKKKFILSWYC
jgi:hypothetical protein